MNDIVNILNTNVNNNDDDINNKVIKIFDSFCDYTFIIKSEVLKLLNSLYFTKEATKTIIYDSKIEHFSFVKSEKDLNEIIKKKFKILNHSAIKKHCENLSDKENKSFHSKLKEMVNDILLNIKLNNQIDIFSVEINPFLAKTMLVREGAKIRLIRNKIHFNRFESEVSNLSAKDKSIYIKDFLEHFPQYLEILDFIVACRFAKSRRKSYLYMRVNAGFGKSLIMDVLKRVGVAMNIELAQLKSNSASELHPTEFLNSFCLCVDEFTHFAQELKALTNKIQISAKFALRTELEVYAKLFFSAEKSTSFFSDAGVDEQLAERVSLLELEGEKKIDDRELFKKNKSKYVEAFYEFTYKYLKIKIAEYLKNSKLDSANIAENFLDEFNNKYKIKADNIEKIRNVIFEVLSEFRDKKEDKIELTSKFEKELDELVFIRTDRKIIVKNITKLYESIIKEQSQSFYKNAIFKQTQLDKIFGVDLKETKVNKDINNKPIRGHLISLDIEREFNFLNKSFKYNNADEFCNQINVMLKDYYQIHNRLNKFELELLESMAHKLRLVVYAKQDSNTITSLAPLN